MVQLSTSGVEPVANLSNLIAGSMSFIMDHERQLFEEVRHGKLIVAVAHLLPNYTDDSDSVVPLKEL